MDSDEVLWYSATYKLLTSLMLIFRLFRWACFCRDISAQCKKKTSFPFPRYFIFVSFVQISSNWFDFIFSSFWGERPWSKYAIYWKLLVEIDIKCSEFQRSLFELGRQIDIFRLTGGWGLTDIFFGRRQTFQLKHWNDYKL